MNFLMRLLRRIRMLFTNSGTDIEDIFGTKLIRSTEMNGAIRTWDDISTGRPPWMDENDEIGTVNMAKLISDTRAKLAVLDIGIAISGSTRADYLQKLADDLLRRLPDRLSDADRLGGMIVKWNGYTWDFILPGDFGITSQDDNGDITGAIFAAYTTQGETRFTRLEYHRFEGSTDESRVYRVSNKAFRDKQNAKGEPVLGEEVPLDQVDAWAHMEPEVYIRNLEKPLFAFYRVPGSNTIDAASPLGLSVFSNALTELRAVDIAISRKDSEVEDSKHITFVGQALIRAAGNSGIQLPRFVKGLGMGMNDTEVSAIHEHVPTLLTDQRIKDINFDLSLAGVKCGFSEGVFVLDGQTGMITATQVEADDRDTIQTIKTDRDALKTALEQAFYGANALATLYNLAPLGEYEVNFNFGDITYNYAEDKAAWHAYVSSGWVPKWLYFVKFEGMSEEEAKKMIAEAEAAARSQAVLFGAE